MLPALTGNPDKPLRTAMFMSPYHPTHMSLRRGKWMYIPAKSDGGFPGSTKPSDHAWGGASVATLVNTPNSDIENGKIKPGAAPAQLYDLEADRNQTKNLYYEHPEITQKMAAAIKKAKLEAREKFGEQAAVGARAKGPGLAEYDEFEPVGDIHYSFESGTLDGWTVTEGEFGQPVTTVPSLISRKDAPFARQGGHHLSTLVLPVGKSLSDKQTGVLQSPAFKLVGGKASFLVSGGFDKKDLFVALVEVNSGDVLIKDGGARDHKMRRIEWDVAKWKGRNVRFEIVDRSKGGWGHLNVDDISVQGESVSTPE
jgi:hypothetical protein